MEVLIQNLLPVGPSMLEREPGRRDWSAVVCLWCSCGKPGHAASQCPILNVTFPFLLPGWQAEKVGGGFVMQLPRMLAERTPDGKRRLIRGGGGGSIARISNDFGPQDPADDDGLEMSTAREHDVPREGGTAHRGLGSTGGNHCGVRSVGLL